jgi:integrase
MPRPATGSVRWNPAQCRWEARITIGAKRVLVPIPDVPQEEPAGARRVAALMSRRARATGAVTLGTGETTNEWFTRYVEVHASLGRGTAEHHGAWDRYVGPFIGTKTWDAVSPHDIKAIRDNLTKLRLAGRISAKRALNVWGEQLKTPLSRAFSDDDPKYSSVRVGPSLSNPALNIRPPASAEDAEQDERARQALEPGEFLRLVSCDAIPLEARRFYSFVAYTGLSPSEFYGLRCSDIRLDAERPHIMVQRGRDMKTGADKTTKTKQRNRKVPIHPELRPLLQVMLDEGEGPAAFLLPVTQGIRMVERRVRDLREHLEAAGVDRPELLQGTDTLLPFDVRSFRTTFATWAAKAGFDSGWVRVWLGHKPQGVAEKNYMKDVPGFGDVNLKSAPPGTVPPFPPLPVSLTSEESASVGPFASMGGTVKKGFGGVLAKSTKTIPFSGRTQCEGRELNPYTR